MLRISASLAYRSIPNSIIRLRYYSSKEETKKAIKFLTSPIEYISNFQFLERTSQDSHFAAYRFLGKGDCGLTIGDLFQCFKKLLPMIESSFTYTKMFSKIIQALDLNQPYEFYGLNKMKKLQGLIAFVQTASLRGDISQAKALLTFVTYFLHKFTENMPALHKEYIICFLMRYHVQAKIILEEMENFVVLPSQTNDLNELKRLSYRIVSLWELRRLLEIGDFKLVDSQAEILQKSLYNDYVDRYFELLQNEQILFEIASSNIMNQLFLIEETQLYDIQAKDKFLQIYKAIIASPFIDLYNDEILCFFFSLFMNHFHYGDKDRIIEAMKLYEEYYEFNKPRKVPLKELLILCQKYGYQSSEIKNILIENEELGDVEKTASGKRWMKMQKKNILLEKFYYKLLYFKLTQKNRKLINKQNQLIKNVLELDIPTTISIEMHITINNIQKERELVPSTEAAAIYFADTGQLFFRGFEDAEAKFAEKQNQMGMVFSERQLEAHTFLIDTNYFAVARLNILLLILKEICVVNPSMKNKIQATFLKMNNSQVVVDLINKNPNYPNLFENLVGLTMEVYPDALKVSPKSNETLLGAIHRERLEFKKHFELIKIDEAQKISRIHDGRTCSHFIQLAKNKINCHPDSFSRKHATNIVESVARVFLEENSLNSLIRNSFGIHIKHSNYREKKIRIQKCCVQYPYVADFMVYTVKKTYVVLIKRKGIPNQYMKECAEAFQKFGDIIIIEEEEDVETLHLKLSD